MTTLSGPIVFALFPGVTQLDFTAPLEVLSRLPGAECVLASKSGGAFRAGPALELCGLAALRDLGECSILLVPGGFGVVAAIEDGEFLAELRRLGRGARYVASVCTGSLVLAAAGQLEGKRAACHWAWRDLLREFGVTPDPARVVRDGNVFSGGGVTAGLDLALEIAAEIEGPDFARCIELGIEYAPHPPFGCGRPEQAPAEIVARVLERLQAFGAERRSAVARAAARLQSEHS